MKAKMSRFLAGVRRVTKAVFVRLAIWYLALQVLSNGLPGVKTWLDQVVVKTNAWFAGLAPWCRAAVSAVEAFLTPMYRWAPLAFHAGAIALIAWAAWRILCLVVKTTDNGPRQQPRQRPQQRQPQQPRPQQPRPQQPSQPQQNNP
jgi:hypothetical protein